MRSGLNENYEIGDGNFKSRKKFIDECFCFREGEIDALRIFLRFYRNRYVE